MVNARLSFRVLCLWHVTNDLQNVIDVCDHVGGPALRVFVDVVCLTDLLIESFASELRLIVRLLLESLNVAVKRLDVSVCYQVVHDFNVVVAGWWVALEHDLTELVEDPESEAVFDQKREDILNGQGFGNVLIWFTDGLQNTRPGDHVLLRVRLPKVIVVKSHRLFMKHSSFA